MPGPLDGVRILDCTSVVLGPWAAQQLGDLGADVIKIEPPEGDTTRQLGPRRHTSMAAFYLGCNRSKRSLVLVLEEEGFSRSEIDAMLPSGATMRPRGDSAPEA
jgi:crotonobetainyl-CoA:carnitine CoA-transferase CaiB-like acyl-CoA transferase